MVVDVVAVRLLPLPHLVDESFSAQVVSRELAQAKVDQLGCMTT
jgi:hypothetical protein